MLEGLDARWAGYVNGTEDGWVPSGALVKRGQVPRKIPFDGVVPNENSAYPTSNGVLRDFVVNGANHQDIYKRTDGLNTVANAMLFTLQMERAIAVTASISGPSGFSSSQTLTWRATAEGGDQAYTYQWSYLPSGASGWVTFGGTGSSVSRTVTMSTASFAVRVTVSSQGQMVSAVQTVTNFSSGSGGGCVAPPGGPPCPQ